MAKSEGGRDFVYIRNHVVDQRVRALEGEGYVEKEGERRTGFVVPLQQLNVRAY